MPTPSASIVPKTSSMAEIAVQFSMNDRVERLTERAASATTIGISDTIGAPKASVMIRIATMMLIKSA